MAIAVTISWFWFWNQKIAQNENETRNWLELTCNPVKESIFDDSL